MFEARPGEGAGVGRYVRLMTEYGGGKPQDAHNFLLQMFAESGALGGLAFIVLGAAVCLGYRRGWQDGWDQQSGLALGGLIGALAFLMTLLAGHALLMPIGQIAFASFVALTAIAVAPVRPHEIASRPPSRARLGLAMAVLLALAAAPISGMMQRVAPPVSRWGYHVGLYEEQRDECGRLYRWTTDRAALDLAVPHRATSVALNAVAAPSVSTGRPARVRITAGATSREWLVST